MREVMSKHLPSHAFIQPISAEVLKSSAVNHPYLQALCEGNLPNIDLAIQDFAFQYGLYSAQFIRYVSVVIESIKKPEHKKILQSNLAEEQGDTHDLDLPPNVLDSVNGQPHTNLFRRFQEALRIDAHYRSNVTLQGQQAGRLWGQQFLELCKMNECVGVGAIGIGTELIVSRIYNQILKALKTHTSLTMTQRVFFDLHSQCDEAHAAQMLSIAEELAQSPTALEQIEYGARMAIDMRITFWDNMLERAHTFPAATPATEKLTAIGY